MATPAQAARSIDEVVRALSKPDEIANVLAAGILDDARTRASAGPTPQASTAASGLRVVDSVISAPAGAVVMFSSGPVRLGDIFGGAEWGSVKYRQFGRRKRRGAFLYPAMTAARRKTGPAYEAAQDVLHEIIERAV